MVSQHRPRFSLLLVAFGSFALMLLAILPGSLQPALGQTAGPTSGSTLRCSYPAGQVVTVSASVCPFGSLPAAGTSLTGSAAGASAGAFSSIAFGGSTAASASPPANSASASAALQPGANGALSFGGNGANSPAPVPGSLASPFGAPSAGPAPNVPPSAGLAFAFQGLNQNVAGSMSASVITMPPPAPFPSFFQFSATTTAVCADLSKSCTATANVGRISFATGTGDERFFDHLHAARVAGSEDGQQLQAGSVFFPAASLCSGSGDAIVRLTVTNEYQPLSATVTGTCGDALDAGEPILAIQAPMTVCLTALQDILDGLIAHGESSLVLLDSSGDALPDSSFDGVQVCASPTVAGSYRVGASE